MSNTEARAILSDEEVLRRRDKDSFDAGFSAGIGWAINTDNEPLFAAAQDVLEALKALRSFMWSEGYADQNLPMAQADAAIAKAEGD